MWGATRHDGTGLQAVFFNILFFGGLEALVVRYTCNGLEGV